MLENKHFNDENWLISTASLPHLFLGCPRLQSRTWLCAVGHVGLLEVEANRKSVQDD